MQYKLKECRQKAGYSQIQAAIAMDTTQHQISKWENGIQDITLGKAIKLADLYKVTLDELAGRNINKEAEKDLESKPSNLLI